MEVWGSDGSYFRELVRTESKRGEVATLRHFTENQQ